MRCPHDWQGYSSLQFQFTRFARGTLVLDVGCGPGVQLEELVREGARGVGVEVHRASAIGCRERGHLAALGLAERLPFRTEAFGGVICKVVVPYTDEARAIGEVGRVLRSAGTARFCYHGAGYYVRYLFGARSPWKLRIYALRSVLNTWVYAALGRRLPGFVGDTLYQSRGRLRTYYDALGLRLVEDHPAPTYCGLPVFIYHVVEKHP